MRSPHDAATIRDGTYDAIVVGAHAAGAATAMLLARRARRVLLLDRSPREPDGAVPQALPRPLLRGGVLQLSRWGLLERIAAGGTPPVTHTTFRYGDETVSISIKPSHGVGAFYAPADRHLRAVLLAAAVEAGVELHHRTTVTDVVVDGDRVVGVRAVTAGGRAVEVRARLVIGADGTRSTIARRVGAPFTRIGAHATTASYAFWPGLATYGYQWIFTPNGRAGVIPTDAGLACVFVSASAERVRAGGIALIRDVVASGAPRLDERLRARPAVVLGRTSAARRGYIRRAHGPGWALVGDAGSFKDPLSPHGSTDALRDADLLAGAVADELDGGALDDALAHYQRARDRLGIPVFDAVDGLAGDQYDEAEIARLLVQLSSAMADEVEALAALDPGPPLSRR